MKHGYGPCLKIHKIYVINKIKYFVTTPSVKERYKISTLFTSYLLIREIVLQVPVRSLLVSVFKKKNSLF